MWEPAPPPAPRGASRADSYVPPTTAIVDFTSTIVNFTSNNVKSTSNNVNFMSNNVKSTRSNVKSTRDLVIFTLSKVKFTYLLVNLTSGLVDLTTRRSTRIKQAAAVAGVWRADRFHRAARAGQRSHARSAPEVPRVSESWLLSYR